MRETPIRPSDDRAVSDTLGFVLMYSILLVSVGLVATTGVDQLSALRDYEQINGAERSVEAMGATFDDVYRRSDPRRTAQLAISGGSVYFRTDTEMKVDTPDGTTTVDLGAIVYTINDATIVYESGGVFRKAGGLVRRPPALSCSNEWARVNALDLSGDEFYTAAGEDAVLIPINGSVPPEERTGAVSDEGTQEITASYDGETVDYIDRRYQSSPSDDDTIELDVSGTAVPEGWGRYLQSNGWTEVDDDTYECTATHAVVRSVTIDLTSSR